MHNVKRGTHSFHPCVLCVYALRRLIDRVDDVAPFFVKVTQAKKNNGCFYILKFCNLFTGEVLSTNTRFYRKNILSPDPICISLY